MKHYRLVEGLPTSVEEEVNKLLATNKWERTGHPFPRLNAEGVHLVVQGMARKLKTHTNQGRTILARGS